MVDDDPLDIDTGVFLEVSFGMHVCVSGLIQWTEDALPGADHIYGLQKAPTSLGGQSFEFHPRIWVKRSVAPPSNCMDSQSDWRFFDSEISSFVGILEPICTRASTRLPRTTELVATQITAQSGETLLNACLSEAINPEEPHILAGLRFLVLPQHVESKILSLCFDDGRGVNTIRRHTSVRDRMIDAGKPAGMF